MFRDKLEYIAIHYNEAKTVGEKGKELVFFFFQLQSADSQGAGNPKKH